MIAICPVCIAGTALVLAGVSSTGGLTAFVAHKIFAGKKADPGKPNSKQQKKEDKHD